MSDIYVEYVNNRMLLLKYITQLGSNEQRQIMPSVMQSFRSAEDIR